MRVKIDTALKGYQLVIEYDNHGVGVAVDLYKDGEPTGLAVIASMDSYAKTIELTAWEDVNDPVFCKMYELEETNDAE